MEEDDVRQKCKEYFDVVYYGDKQERVAVNMMALKVGKSISSTEVEAKS